MAAKIKKRRMDPARIDAILSALGADEVQRIQHALKNAPPPKQKKRTGRPAINLQGKQFHSWLVGPRLPPVPGKPVMWVCLCVCGAVGKVAGTNFVRGQSKQCRSCAGREVAKNLGGGR